MAAHLFDEQGNYKRELKMRNGGIAIFQYIDRGTRKVFYKINCPFCKTEQLVWLWLGNSSIPEEKMHPDEVIYYRETPFGRLQICPKCGIHFTPLLA